MMVILSAIFGGGSGLVGTLVSTMGKGWPTGPFIVVASSVLFTISLVFGAEKGLLTQALLLRSQKKEHMDVANPNPSVLSPRLPGRGSNQ